MRTIPFNAFLEFLSTPGLPRVKLTKSLREAPFRTDFYQPVVDAIRDLHTNERGAGDELLDAFLAARTDPKEQTVFPRVVKGYRRFLAANKASWFEPPSRDYPLGPINVVVDPEVGLLLNGRPHVLKLYMGRELPTLDQISAVTTLLTRALSTTWPGTEMCLLDVRRAKLHVHKADERTGVLLTAEAQSLGSLCASAG